MTCQNLEVKHKHKHKHKPVFSFFSASMPEVFFVSSIQADNGQILSLDPFKEHVFAHKVFEMFVDVKSNHVLQLFSIELDHQP